VSGFGSKILVNASLNDDAVVRDSTEHIQAQSMGGKRKAKKKSKKLDIADYEDDDLDLTPNKNETGNLGSTSKPKGKTTIVSNVDIVEDF